MESESTLIVIAAVFASPMALLLIWLVSTGLLADLKRMRRDGHLFNFDTYRLAQTKQFSRSPAANDDRKAIALRVRSR